jgi:hypothetical protein
MSVFIQFITSYSDQVIARTGARSLSICVSVFFLVFILNVSISYTLNYKTYDVFSGQEESATII